MAHHPIQPLEKDNLGVLRFKPNAIVQHLLYHGGITLNHIACLGFSDEDQQQFAQLIGYSLDGYSELNYVDDVAFETANAMAQQPMTEVGARIEVLEAKLSGIRTALKPVVCVAFRVHPVDLTE